MRQVWFAGDAILVVFGAINNHKVPTAVRVMELCKGREELSLSLRDSVTL